MNHEAKTEQPKKELFFERISLKHILWILGIVIIALLIFKAGEFVGYNKAGFSYRMGEKYYRGGLMSMNGRSGFTPPGFMDGDFLIGHGTLGTILSINGSSFVVSDDDNMEKMVVVASNTAIRRFRDSITFAQLNIGDGVIVIGDPDDSGQINAKLVRVTPQKQLPSSPVHGTLPSGI